MSEPVTTSSATLLQTVAQYYASCLERFGPTPRGVDWNSAASQELRFGRLLEVLPRAGGAGGPATMADSGPVSVLDVGCGYGALLDYIGNRGMRLDYRGFDISEAMIAAARSSHGETGGEFTSDAAALKPASYAVASGIFNVKLQHATDRWREYVLETLALMHRLSIAGFAFNMLSTYSDADRRRDELYYADPVEMFDLCKRQFSTAVALLHDYPLYEFTIIVRK